MNAQPRSHSASTHSAGNVPSHAGAPLVAKKRAPTKHAVATNSASFVEGDNSYLGTELNGGFTWRFAPNAAFDLAAYYLFAGSALETTELLNGVPVKRNQNDAYYATARVRLSF